MKAADPDKTKSLTLIPSRGFAEWLADTGSSLAFTTYEGGSVIFLGTAPDGQVSIIGRVPTHGVRAAAFGEVRD